MELLSISKDRPRRGGVLIHSEFSLWMRPVGKLRKLAKIILKH